MSIVRRPSLLFLGLLASCGAAAPGEESHQSAPEASPAPDIRPLALRAAVRDAPSKRLYALRTWQPIWDDAHTRVLMAAIESARADGLAPERFLVAVPIDPVRREAILTRAALRLTAALAKGAVDPAQFRQIYTLPRADMDVVGELAQALTAGNLGRFLSALAPSDAEYRALSAAYLAYRAKAQAASRQPIPSGPTLRVGNQDPRVPAIRARLRDLGYAVEATAVDADQAYSLALAGAVEMLQDDSGLRRDGALGPATLAILNRSAAERARQLAVNLERLRWLPRNPPETRIDVNTAAAELIFWHKGRAIDRRRVAVGRQGWATPQLGAPIFRLVANPSWTVPKSIARTELAGKSAAALAARGMYRKGSWIVQKPGPGNALGQVKFDMRDRYAIYLHDTPARGIFERNVRHLSHGCVRVADALGFARLLADLDGKRSRFDAAMASGRERYIPLSEPIPVRLLYLTAFVDARQVVRFRPDIYGWDDDVGKALGLGRGRRIHAPAAAPDIAP